MPNYQDLKQADEKLRAATREYSAAARSGDPKRIKEAGAAETAACNEMTEILQALQAEMDAEGAIDG